MASLGSRITAMNIEAEQTCVIHDVINVFQLKIIHWLLN